MAYRGHPAGDEDDDVASPKGGWQPSRGFWLGMGVVVFFAGVLAAAGAMASDGAPEPVVLPTEAPPTVVLTTIPRQVTPEPDMTQNLGGSIPLSSAPSGSAVEGGQSVSAPIPADATSSALVSPTVIASSWSTTPVFAPPAPAPPAGPSAASLAQQAKDRFGVEIVLEGQDWGADDTSQVRNIGAVISAMEMLPLRVTSSVAANPNGPLAILSNGHGRTQDGWQPYGDSARNFYTNSDQGPAGYRAANEIVLWTGSSRTTAAHEILHAYQFRDVNPDDYVLTLLGDEMRSYMAATGWRQLVSDDEVRATARESWDKINAMFVYEGRAPTYLDDRGSLGSAETSNALEAFATAGALYYARPDGMALPDWPEFWDWFRDHLG